MHQRCRLQAVVCSALVLMDSEAMDSAGTRRWQRQLRPFQESVQRQVVDKAIAAADWVELEIRAMLQHPLKLVATEMALESLFLAKPALSKEFPAAGARAL